MSTQENKSAKERELITTGYYAGRYPMLVLAVIFGLNLISDPSSWVFAILLLISIGFYFLFRRSRRIYYDDKNLYLLRHKEEVIVPLTEIVSIKRSRAKVNGSRFWILIYKDKQNQEKRIRYFRTFFVKDFHQKVKKENPAVVIWTHPFFNH